MATTTIKGKFFASFGNALLNALLPSLKTALVSLLRSLADELEKPQNDVKELSE